MEYMTEKYTDGSYIGIAVHANDRMQATSYAPMIQSYYSNFPTAIVNRDASIDPNSQEMEQAYQYYSAIRGAGQVELDIEKINGTTDADVKATAEFAVPGKYAIAYVVKENGVGPYQQQNAYAGGRYGAMGGFEKKGNPYAQWYSTTWQSTYSTLSALKARSPKTWRPASSTPTPTPYRSRA